MQKTVRPEPSFRSRLIENWLATGALSSLLGCAALQAADVVWDGGTAGTGTAWRTAANWAGDVTPGANDNSIIDAVGSVTILGVDMNGAAGTQQVDSISLGAGRTTSLTIRNSSTTVPGVLQLNGSGGVLLSNVSAANITLTFTNGTSQLMGLGLAASGDIYVEGTQAGFGDTIQIYSVISDVGGPRSINKVGGGILYLRGVNTYSGNTTNTAGSLQVDATGTFGTGTLYLNGGDIICAADRSGGAPLANPVVMTADARIINNAGTAGTSRTIPFSGAWGGSAGSLRIINNTAAANNTFQVRMAGGGFDFSRNISIGVVPSGSFALLQLYNTATNGMQTFSGTISDDFNNGGVWRSGAAGTPPGVTAFTGDNTYSGGTRISYGTLLANNSSGSALGFGAVVVTNLGVLGGNGTVTAPTAVSLGGTISPGSMATNIGNLNVSDLTVGEGGAYPVQIASASGTPGVAWDVVTVSGGSGAWSDVANSGNPFTIKLDSFGVSPSGWNSTVARDWVIIDGGGANGFDASHFALDSTAFAGTIAGVFSLSASDGNLHLIYTPAPDIVLNVPTGSQTQSQLGYPTLSGTVGLVKIGNGEAVINNAANDYLGQTRILAGTMTISVDALNGSGAFGNATTAVLLGNTLGDSNATLNVNTDGVTLGRNVVVQSGSTGVKTAGTMLTGGVAFFTGDVTLQDDLTITAPAGGVAAFSGMFGGTGGLNKTGAGTIYLTNGNNTFTGKTKILGGTLSVDGIGRLGTSPATQVDDQVTLDGATLEYLAGTVASGSNGGFLIGSLGGTFNVMGGTLTLNGPISGAGNLVKTGPNRLDLNHATNSYVGDTFINDGDIGLDGDGKPGLGTLYFNGGNLAITANRSTTPSTFITNSIVMNGNTTIRTSGGTANTSRIAVFNTDSIVTTGGMLTISNGATANTNTFDLRLLGAGFNFTRPIYLDAGLGVGSIVQLFLGSSNGTAPQTFSAEISGNGRIRRSAQVASDAGTTIFTAANTYSGGTVVAAGTLLVNNTSGSGTGTGSVSVTNTGVLGGTGTISGDVAVASGGSIAPGASAGTLTVQAGVDFSTNGTYIWELAANSINGPGVNYDLLAVTGGNVALGGSSKLALKFSGTATAPDAGDPFWQSAHSWTILTVSGTAANPGSSSFATITNSFTSGTFTNYADAGGNIVLAFTPSATVAPPQIASFGRLNDGNFTLNFSGVSGQPYSIRATTNVTLPRSNWTVLSTGNFGASPISFDDLNATNFPRRFYSISIP